MQPIKAPVNANDAAALARDARARERNERKRARGECEREQEARARREGGESGSYGAHKRERADGEEGRPPRTKMTTAAAGSRENV